MPCITLAAIGLRAGLMCKQGMRAGKALAEIRLAEFGGADGAIAGGCVDKLAIADV